MTIRKLALFALLLPACGLGGSNGTNTGNSLTIDGSGVFYTAENTLGATQTDILMVGLPGSLSEGGGTLAVTNVTSTDSATRETVGPNGDFVSVIPAVLGDSVEMMYAVAAEDTSFATQLNDDLSAIAAPRLKVGETLLGALSMGQVEVNLGGLEASSMPHVLFSVEQGSTALVPAILTTMGSLNLPGASGDQICIFATDSAMAASGPALCAIVP